MLASFYLKQYKDICFPIQRQVEILSILKNLIKVINISGVSTLEMPIIILLKSQINQQNVLYAIKVVQKISEQRQPTPQPTYNSSVKSLPTIL